MSLTAGTEDYTLDTSILRILDIFITSSSQDYSMERVSVDDILRFRRAAAATSSAPVTYYAVAGSNLLMVYPTPASADTVTVYYVPRPATLSADDDTPSEIPSEFHKLVEWYALAEAADYDDDGSSGVGQLYLAKYEEGIARARATQSRKGSTRLAPFVPGRRSRVVKHSPSQDMP